MRPKRRPELHPNSGALCEELLVPGNEWVRYETEGGRT